MADENDVHVLFMFESQNIAAVLPEGSSVEELLEKFFKLFDLRCAALQSFDRDWDEWLNLPGDFKLLNRMKLKAVGAAKQQSYVYNNTKMRQSVLGNVSGNICVAKTHVTTKSKPPYSSFLSPIPQSEMLKYYNEITPKLCSETAKEFASTKEFHNYLIIERKFMFETDKEVSEFSSFIENIKSNVNNELGQDVHRFRKVPEDVCSGDVQRCVNTIYSIEKKIEQGETIRCKLQECKKTCYSAKMDFLPGGKTKFEFLEQKNTTITECVQNLNVMLGKLHEVYQCLCSQEEALKLGKKKKRRQKRRLNEKRKKYEKWKENMQTNT